ncbi:MAG: PQQ-dependent dehydrogenase, methanol/ethanol family [Hyphomonadaceae bacterium]|nr:PQQ-dependent dehydrogenase, methanol/ethanol family [Hyphomonadaceae bacterium]
MTFRASLFTLALGVSALAACSPTADEPTEPAVEPVLEDADWTRNGLTDFEQRHAPLDQINTETVDRLGLAWMFQDFIVRGRVHRGNQGTPLVVDGVMYATGPWSVVYALDAATGKELWIYDPEVEGAWARKACCDVNNKGVAYQDGVLFLGVVDGYLDAVDAETGERLWRADTLTDRTRSYTVTGAPRVAGDVVVIGSGGGDMDARGYVSAYNVATGELAWRFFTVPGDPALGDEHPELTMARETWGEDARWDVGLGGTVYDSIVYDPETDTVFAGTSNGVPHPTWLRDPTFQGDNLFLSSILAIDAGTGRLKWHYQTTPADNWDFGSTQNMILADIEIGGDMRPVLMQAPKNGFFYVLDRNSGELLTAEPFTTVTWASHVDMETGRPVLNERLDYEDGPKVIWPSVSGGHNWQPMAFSPETGLVYIPVLEAPMKYVGYDGVEYQPGSLNEGKGPPLMPPFDEDDQGLLDGQPEPTVHSVLKAWDPVAQESVWESELQPWWSGGVLSTSGGLIFQGAPDGIFRVYDATTGDLLKQIDTGIAILAPPMTYAVDGVQYVAVLGGLGGSESAYFPDQAAAHRYQNPETLFVFKLDGGEVPLPPEAVEEVKQPLPDPVEISEAALGNGAELYYHHCARCHSYRGSPGAYPNLWNMTPAMHENFMAVLMDGQLSYAGMAPFSDVLSQEDADAIYGFLVSDRLTMAEEGDQQTGTRFQDID